MFPDIHLFTSLFEHMICDVNSALVCLKKDPTVKFK